MTSPDFTDKQCSVLMLPGLHGSSRLFQALVDALPPFLSPRLVDYPNSRDLGYAELLPVVREQAPRGPYIVVAESFSGPLAVMLAASQAPGLLGLALFSTFVTSPRPVLLRWLPRCPRSALRSQKLARLATRIALLNGCSSESLIDAVAREARTLEPAVVERRLREIISVNLVDETRSLAVPTVYVVGNNDRLLPRSNKLLMEQLLGRDSVQAVPGPHLLLQAAPEFAIKTTLGLCERTVPR